MSIMAIIRWCPIFPKWDIYQPLQNDSKKLCRSTCLSLNRETSPTTNDMGISSRNVLLNGESSVGTLLKMMSFGWALSSPHWRLEMEWFTQPKLGLAMGQTKTTWGWSSGAWCLAHEARVCTQINFWTRELSRKDVEWSFKMGQETLRSVEKTKSAKAWIGYDPCETSQVWISSNT